MNAKRATINAAPEPLNLPRDAVKAEFARNLERHMLQKGWTQSDMARQAALHMPDKKFGRDLIGMYVRGATLPTPIHFKALYSAIGCKPEDLAPNGRFPGGNDRSDRTGVATLSVNDAGQGYAFVRINMAMPWEKALKVLALAKEVEDEGKE